MDKCLSDRRLHAFLEQLNDNPAFNGAVSVLQGDYRLCECLNFKYETYVETYN